MMRDKRVSYSLYTLAVWEWISPMHSARRFTASKYNFALTFTHGQFSKAEKKTDI